MLFSELIGKEVFSLAEGKNLGYVLGGKFDGSFSKLLTLCIVNDEDEFNYILSVENVKKVLPDFLLCQTEKNLTLTTNGQEYDFVIMNRALSTNGDSCKIKDVTLTKNFKVHSLELFDGKIIFASKCLCFGGALIYGNKSREKLGSGAENCPNILVKMLTEKKVPTKIQPINFTYLIGKRLKENLVASNGEILAKKGEKITESILSCAKRFGKLSNLLK